MDEKKIRELAMEYGLKCDPLNHTLKKQADIRQGFIEGMNQALILCGASLSLLKVARCPNSNCDNNGTIGTWNEYDNEWEPEPCQWCYEKKKLLNNEG
jgi:hypothetical protein